MIGAALNVLGRLGHPIPLLLIANVVVIAGAFGLWHVGQWVGYAEGVEAQKQLQAEADQQQGDQIRERVKDALDEMGVGFDDADVDSILRGLAGQ